MGFGAKGTWWMPESPYPSGSGILGYFSKKYPNTPEPFAQSHYPSATRYLQLSLGGQFGRVGLAPFYQDGFVERGKGGLDPDQGGQYAYDKA